MVAFFIRPIASSPPGDNNLCLPNAKANVRIFSVIPDLSPSGKRVRARFAPSGKRVEHVSDVARGRGGSGAGAGRGTSWRGEFDLAPGAGAGRGTAWLGEFGAGLAEWKERAGRAEGSGAGARGAAWRASWTCICCRMRPISLLSASELFLSNAVSTIFFHIATSRPLLRKSSIHTVAVAHKSNTSCSSSPDMSTKEETRRRLQLEPSRDSDSCEGMTARCGLIMTEPHTGTLFLTIPGA